MMNKRNLYIVLAIVIIIGFLNILYIDYLNRKIFELETTKNQLHTELDTKNMQIEIFTEQITLLENTIHGLDTALIKSQLNSSHLKAETKALNSSIVLLKKDNELLEEAIHIIGIGELGIVLKEYGETVKQLEELQHEHNQLQRDYNKLLAQQ